MPAINWDIATPVIAGNVFDISTTLYALQNPNVFEANPIVAKMDKPEMIAAKAASTCLQLWALQKLAKTHPKLARGIAIGIGVGMGAVGVNNIIQGKKR